MARGGFHGGSTHSGGFHSGGGGYHGGGSHSSSGGGFSGGSRSSGSSSSGSGFRHSSGFSGGGYGDDDFAGGMYETMTWFAIIAVIGVITFVGFFVKAIAEGEVPGLNLVNLGIFCVSFFVFIPALVPYERTSDLKGIESSDLSKFGGRIWNAKGPRPPEAIGDKRTWVSKTDKRFCISFFDNEYGPENARKVLETMRRTPRIIWMNPFKWLMFSLICFVVNFFFYEMVIPTFENMIMTDFAFAFIDVTVFYFMSVLSLILSAACLVLGKVKDNILHECAVRIVEDNLANEEKIKTEGFIKSKLSEKWFHNFCPDCGTKASNVLTSCPVCGASLEVMSFEDGIPGAVHRVSYESLNAANASGAVAGKDK
jgi:hypothetical protein